MSSAAMVREAGSVKASETHGRPLLLLLREGSNLYHHQSFKACSKLQAIPRWGNRALSLDFLRLRRSPSDLPYTRTSINEEECILLLFNISDFLQTLSHNSVHRCLVDMLHLHGIAFITSLNVVSSYDSLDWGMIIAARKQYSDNKIVFSYVLPFVTDALPFPFLCIAWAGLHFITNKWINCLYEKSNTMIARRK